MTDWTEGYVAELDYAHAFYAEMAPAHLAFALLLRGIRPPAALNGDFSYCELGCGQGLTSNLLAALHPQSRFEAVDFLPAHMTAARELAEACGNRNVHFRDDSFAAFAEQDGEPFDVIALHGVWSWVSAANRALLLDILRRRLAPGGVVYVSYNALPGWAAQMPVRRLLLERVAGEVGDLPSRIGEAMDFAQRLARLDCGYFAQVPGAVAHLNGLDGKTDSYLAHEYLNRDWAPFYHSEVAAEMATAKLSFAASATLLDNRDDDLPARAVALLAEAHDATQRETLRDFVTYNRFRRDVYLRGPLPLTEAERRHRLGAVRFGLAHAQPPATGVALEARLLEMLAVPQSLDALIDASPDAGFDAVLRALVTLTGLGAVVPVGAACPEGAARFNAAVLERNRWSPELRQLASPLLGAGVVVGILDRLFLLATQRQVEDPAAFAWDILAERGRRLIRDGEEIRDAAANLAEMRRLHVLWTGEERVWLERLGIGV